MGYRASAKLLISFMLKYNHIGLPQKGPLQLKESRFKASHEALQRQEIGDAKHKADGEGGNRPVPSAGAWEALIVQTEHAKVGGAKPVEALKTLIDELEPFAAADNTRMAAACLCVAHFYVFSDSSEHEPVSLLPYVQRAHKVYSSRPESLEHVQCLYILGYAYLKMEELETAQVHLEQCASALKQLKVLPGFAEYVTFVKLEVQVYLGQAKLGLCKHLEARTYFQNFIGFKEKSLMLGHPEVAASYLRIAQCYHKGRDLDAAMSLASKAFAIYMRGYGPSSLQVANVRRLMSEMYYKLGKYEECLSENEEARPILEYLGKMEDVATLDLESARCLVHLKKFKEAITLLQEVVKITALTNKSHVLALVLIARVHALLDLDDSAAEYCKRAHDILEQQEATFHAAGILVFLGLVFEKQQKFEQALAVTKRAKEILGQCPRHQAAETTAQVEGILGALLLKMERNNEALPYLERCVSKDRNVRGLQSKEILQHHIWLGTAYSRVKRLEDALQQFEAAKKVSAEGFTGGDASMAIVMHDKLAHAYLSLDRLDEAIECQKVVVNLLNEDSSLRAEIDSSLIEAEAKLFDLQRKAEFHETNHEKS